MKYRHSFSTYQRACGDKKKDNRHNTCNPLVDSSSSPPTSSSSFMLLFFLQKQLQLSGRASFAVLYLFVGVSRSRIYKVALEEGTKSTSHFRNTPISVELPLHPFEAMVTPYESLLSIIAAVCHRTPTVRQLQSVDYNDLYRTFGSLAYTDEIERLRKKQANKKRDDTYYPSN